ncbi:MAG TPA: anti-sigma factor [Solirubrobacteraceae bacterium]|jgi:anti-sigma-K factor RskA|nr:anti-sigma factor [Solirubrobacteraceae bacterium]
MSLRESDFDCPHRADAAAYVLGALEEDELQRFRAHIDDCAQCRAEVTELQAVADELPASVAPAVASDALRQRILATVRSEAQLLSAAGHEADRPVTSKPRWYRRNDFLLGIGAAAAAGVAALVAVLIAVGSSGHANVTVSEGEGLGPARSAQVSLRQRDGRAELVVAHMPQPAIGRIYEVWLSHGPHDARPTNALFGVTGSGSGAVGVPDNLHGVKEVMVTSEPSGGSDHPTSPPLIRVALSA